MLSAVSSNSLAGIFCAVAGGTRYAPPRQRRLLRPHFSIKPGTRDVDRDNSTRVGSATQIFIKGDQDELALLLDLPLDASDSASAFS